jgi:CBS domain-containing protein
MTRTFLHSFDPPAANPVTGATVDLDVSDIEDAGIREVLQTPGAAYGSWSILDALLTPTGTGTPFIFREPLGQAREVKVALSGLFGRFVARAYLERYFNLSIFAHLGSRIIDLDRRRQVKIMRLSRGDLPDWIACASDLSSLTVAEAKGCHDVSGPAKALDRAWAQAGRIDITAGGRKVTVKRVAIATRWGMAVAGPTDAQLSVRDPVDEGEPIKPEEKDALFIGLLRLHIANLIRPLGHAELAGALHRLTQQPFARRLQGDAERARALLDASSVRDVEKASAIGGLVGGIVTRAGPVTDANVEPAEQETLSRLNLRPVFVGIERDLIRAAIDAEPQAVRNRLTSMVSPDEFARPDRAGGWIIPLGEERHITGGT